jgi:hypothetical protein
MVHTKYFVNNVDGGQGPAEPRGKHFGARLLAGLKLLLLFELIVEAPRNPGKETENWTCLHVFLSAVLLLTQRKRSLRGRSVF